jgi:hypothetical protein
MKQTPPAGVCFRQEPPLTEAVKWRTVRPPPPLAAKSSQRQSAPWGPIIIAAGLVTAALIIANGNKPAPPEEPNLASPSERLVTANQSEPAVPRAQPVIWRRAEAAGPTTLFSPEWYESQQSWALGLPGDPERGSCLDPLPGSATKHRPVASAPEPLGRILDAKRNLGLDDSSRRNNAAVGRPISRWATALKAVQSIPRSRTTNPLCSRPVDAIARGWSRPIGTHWWFTPTDEQNQSSLLGAAGVRLSCGTAGVCCGNWSCLSHGHCSCQGPLSAPPRGRFHPRIGRLPASKSATLCAGVSTALIFAPCSAI